MRTITSLKQSFCIAPTDPVDLTVPGAEAAQVALGFGGTVCDLFEPGSIWVREALPVGWGDTYTQAVAGQAFDLTHVPNGSYKLVVRVNPLGLLHETSSADDVAVRRIRLTGPRDARRVQVAPGTASAADAHSVFAPLTGSSALLTATYGIDLASQPKKTAACLIEWNGRRGRVDSVSGGQDDHQLLSVMEREDDVTRVGIDSPFGWPRDFVEVVSAYLRDGRWPDAPGSSEAQQLMRLRATDRAVHKLTALTPLSVSTDRIGVVAMRCARLLAAYWRSAGQSPDRSGSGRILEVYPAGALRCWGVAVANEHDPGSYKGNDPGASARRERTALPADRHDVPLAGDSRYRARRMHRQR